MVKDRKPASFLSSTTEKKTRASMGKPLVFRLRYASQVLGLQMQSQYLNPQANMSGDSIFTPGPLLRSRTAGDYVLQSSITTPAHSDESYMQNYGKWVETPTPRTKHESKMRLLKTHSTPLNGMATKPATYVRKRKEDVASRSRKKSPTKNHRHVRGARKMHWKVKSEYKENEKKKITRKRQRNTENPTYN